MIAWQFKTYVSASGRNDVQETVDGYDPYGRQSFSRAVAHLVVSPKSQWHEPQGKKLKNEDHKGRVYKPPKAFEIAHRRIKEIQSGSATNVPLQVDGEDFPPHDEKPG